MFKSLTFLWKYAWNVQKSYLVCLILYQITNTIPPLLIMFFPKVLLDELTNGAKSNFIFTYIYHYLFNCDFLNEVFKRFFEEYGLL